MDNWDVSTFLATIENDDKLIWAYVLICVGYKPRSGIAGLYGNSACSLLKNCQTVLQSG